MNPTNRIPPISAPILDHLKLAATAALPLMQRVRRHMHSKPELSMREFETTLFLAKTLSELGLSPQPTERGVGLVFDWTSRDSEQNIPRVGLRADIDALPIQSVLDAEYASQVDGVMHACGHDAHSAVLIGAVVTLLQIQQEGLLEEPVAIRGILQPAEETSEGALYMIEQGAVEGICAALAVHVDPHLPTGNVASRIGAFTAGCDELEINFRGRSGHSARPYEAIDALAAANSWIQQAYARTSRVHDCRDPAIFSIGTFHSGVAPNVVAESARLTGTLRTISDHSRKEVFDALNAVSTSVEAAHACQVSMQVTSHTPSLHNHAEVTRAAMRVAKQLFGDSAVGEIAMPSMGAEDFAFYCRHIPCCMFRLGTAGPPEARGNSYASHLHAPDFDIDEHGLVVGAQLLAASAIQLSELASSDNWNPMDFN